MDGLSMKNGREINNRPNSETGIAQAARLKKQMEKIYKVECIAQGIELAESRKNLKNILRK